MAKSDFSFVLEDDLLEEYFKFTKPDKFPNEEYDEEIIKSLLSYRTMPFLYNIGQITRLETKLNTNLVDNSLKYTLRDNHFTTQSLEDLAKKTFYRCILSKDKNHFPYVKIGGSDKIITSVTGSFYYRESRQKAIDHIHALCADAKEIIIWDEFVMENNYSLTALKKILPNSDKVKIIIHNSNVGKRGNSFSYIPDDFKTALNKINKDWNIEKRALKINQHHDRYLIIDNKQEIVLTSGLRYLEEENKEITYIIKPYKGHLYDQ